MSFFKRLGIGARLTIMGGILVAAMGCMSAIQTKLYMDSLWSERQASTQKLVESAVAITARYDEERKAGRLTDAQARAAARAAVGAMRFGGSGYVWINDLSGGIVMHPIKPQLDGTAGADVRDSNGVSPFVAAAQSARSGGGFFTYLWPKPGETEPLPKVSYAQQFKPWGWVLASGVYVDDVEAAVRHHVMVLGAWLLGACAAGAVIALLIVRSIVVPVRATTAVMERMARGERDMAMPSHVFADEIAAMIAMLEIFRHNLADADRMAAERARSQQQSVERAQTISARVERFESEASELVSIVASAATQLETTAKSMNRTASQSSTEAQMVHQSSDHSRQMVLQVASAAHELSQSIAQISEQMERSARRTQEAAEDARRTDDTVRALARCADRIGNVVGLITTIASQTNLLALNASVEAARAGEAGKGFAVVASEVRALAGKTSEATQEITTLIDEIRTVAGKAGDAIHHITDLIQDVDGITSSISESVHQQGQATAAIAQNMDAMTVESDKVSRNVQSLGKAATSTGVAASQVLGAAAELPNKRERRARGGGFFAHAPRAA